MHVICDCTAALTEAFEDVEVEGSQNVTVHNGYVRPNSLRIHAAFSHWNHFGSLTLLLGQVEGRAIFFWPISDASTSSYSFLFCITLAPNLFSSSALPHLSPTSPSAFHPDFKACLSLSLPAFPPWVISAFKLLTCEVHISLPIPLLTHGSSSSLPLPSKTFHSFFPQSQTPLISTELLSPVLTSKSIHDPLPTYRSSAHSSTAMLSLLLHRHQQSQKSFWFFNPALLYLYRCQFPPHFMLWLSTSLFWNFVKLCLSRLNHMPLPTSAPSDLPLLLWRIASGNPTARLTTSVSNSFQILSVHSFLKFAQEEFSELSYLNVLPQQIYRTLTKSLQEKLYF